MKQQQNNRGEDIKSELKVRSGKSSKHASGNDKKTATAGKDQKTADKIVQGDKLEQGSRGGDTTDPDNVKK